ncbi:hypothetical protein [Cellulosimicrobium cellulans]|uniref:hypothetical protein n=1 Tax=Cellulosimicrobium cellulans TaxID=1710 RepID=UPI0024051C7E|nr:hypothetical protein [Cellulosimicrobium cellulans]MDF9875061.1 hypothetical protein [Cellulosimicrobium cellulans]
MNDSARRDDDTRPLGDELFDTPQHQAAGADAHPTVPLSTEPPATEQLAAPTAPEPLPTEPLPAARARDGETSVLEVPGPAALAHPVAAPGGPTTSGPTSGTVPSAGPSLPATPTTPTAPVAPTDPSSLVRRGPRVSTIVWGFVIVAFGVVVLAAALGAQVDLGLATIVVLAAAGLTLVVGSIVSGARRRRG